MALTLTHVVVYAKTGVCAQTHPLVNFGGLQVGELDASHYCHNVWCVNGDHIGFEPATVNASRRTCDRRKHCYGHTGHPNCIIFKESDDVKEEDEE